MHDLDGAERRPRAEGDQSAHVVPRSRRQFTPTDPKAKGFDDPIDRAVRLRAGVVTFMGIVVGGLSGVRAAAEWGLPGWTAVLFAFAGGLVFGAGYLTVVLGSGRIAQQVYAPTGSTTPRRAEYSYAESLAVRGDYEGAISAFEMIVAENPADPMPYLSIARIYRDRLSRYSDAERWFKRMTREATAERAMDVLARRELVELYRGKMGAPTRAAPVLARMAEDFEGTPEGVWATAELAEVKALIPGSTDED